MSASQVLFTFLSRDNRTCFLDLKWPIARYQHLNAVRMDYNDRKDKLPIHVILGVSEHARIKTCSKPLVGGPGGPVAEQTKFGPLTPQRTKTRCTRTSKNDLRETLRDGMRLTSLEAQSSRPTNKRSRK